MPVVGAWVAGTLLDLAADTAAYAAVSTIVTAVVEVAVSLVVSKITQAMAGKPSQLAANSDRTITAKGAIQFRQLIYGQVRTGGYLAFYGSSGIESRFLLDYLE